MFLGRWTGPITLGCSNMGAVKLYFQLLSSTKTKKPSNRTLDIFDFIVDGTKQNK